MNLTQLRYFVAVVENGSMTKAAQVTFVSQSAISKTIKQLEGELGVLLFNRVGKNIILNRQGKLFYSYVVDGLRLIDHGVRDVTVSQSKGMVPVTLLYLVTSPMIPLITIQIKKHLPNIRLNIVQHIQANTDLDQFDLIIGDHGYAGRKNKLLFTEEIVLGGYQLPLSIQAEELVNRKLISLDESAPLRKTIDTYYQNVGIDLHYQYETDDPATLREMALSGIGDCLVPEQSWRTLLDHLDVSRILPNPPTRQIMISQKKSRTDVAIREVATEIIRFYHAQSKGDLSKLTLGD